MLSLPSFPEGLVAAAPRPGRRHLRRRRVHHGAGEAAGVPRRRRRLHIGRLNRRRLHVRLPRRQRGRRRRVASRRRVRCFAQATETGKKKTRAQFSSVQLRPSLCSIQGEVTEETKVPELARGSPTCHGRLLLAVVAHPRATAQQTKVGSDQMLVRGRGGLYI